MYPRVMNAEVDQAAIAAALRQRTKGRENHAVSTVETQRRAETEKLLRIHIASHFLDWIQLSMHATPLAVFAAWPVDCTEAIMPSFGKRPRGRISVEFSQKSGASSQRSKICLNDDWTDVREHDGVANQEHVRYRLVERKGVRAAATLHCWLRHCGLGSSGTGTGVVEG